MPSIPIHPLDASRANYGGGGGEGMAALPQLLQTPSGLAIVEIQGSLNVPAATTTTTSPATAAASPIGKLVFPHYDPANDAADDTSWHKRVYLYVGKHQRLTGEVKKLAKPLAVIRRKPDPRDGVEELEVAEVVYYKLLFAHRPEPVGGGD